MKILLKMGFTLNWRWKKKGVSELEDGSIEITQYKEQRDKNKDWRKVNRASGTFRKIMNYPNVCVTGVPGEEISESGAENSVRT